MIVDLHYVDIVGSCVELWPMHIYDRSGTLSILVVSDGLSGTLDAQGPAGMTE